MEERADGVASFHRGAFLVSSAPPNGGEGNSPEEVYAEYLLAEEAGDRPSFDLLCRANPAIRDELQRLHAREGLARERARGQRLGPLASPAGSADAPEAGAILGNLRGRGAVPTRYRIVREIGRGGMGTVFEAEDLLLRRIVALKVISDSRLASRLVPLFHREMLLASGLSHPGIAGIHDAGVDELGRAFFTMPLIRGRDLSEVFALCAAGDPAWPRSRAVAIVRQVCETMAYVHSRGVIHRDLKPSNVRVGDFGEVFVMDWGLAKEAATPELAPVPVALPAGIASLPGDARGSPPYMSPEQVRGDLDRIGPATDVYAIGAVLYELLAGRAPYIGAGEKPRAAELAARIAEGPPVTLASIARDLPLELVAICERAMARRIDDRYPDAAALASDLQAYLDGRVPAAFPVGPWGQAKKWCSRNRSVASLLAAALFLLVLGSISTVAWLALRETRERDYLDLDAYQELGRLSREQAQLWPVRVRDEAKYAAWLARADQLLSDRAGIERAERRFREIESRGSTIVSDDGSESLEFDSPEDTLWHGILGPFLGELHRFADPVAGLVDRSAASSACGMSVARRLELCREVVGPLAASTGTVHAWEVVRDSIRRDWRFRGFEPDPCDDLLPLTRDPHSGLWEFALVTTGDVPMPRPEGGYGLRAEDALVLVLVPGGTFWMGAQLDCPNEPNFDSHASPIEGPVTSVTLAPFFISKYELTQGQWHALTRDDPSTYGAVGMHVSTEESGLHPVEGVDWDLCRRILAYVDLELPTEAQWEYAARAGTSTPWWTGVGASSLSGAANVADRKAEVRQPTWTCADFDDGAFVHAPVGSYRPNAFGLHDMAGNVMEWCRDSESIYQQESRSGDGLREGVENARKRSFRGGAWDGGPLFSRSAFRNFDMPQTRFYSLGVRPVRAAVGRGWTGPGSAPRGE